MTRFRCLPNKPEINNIEKTVKNDKKTVFSRGKRKRLQIIEKKNKIKELIQKTSNEIKQEKDIRIYGKGLGDTRQLMNIFEKVDKQVINKQNLEKFIQLKKELNKITLSNNQIAKIDQIGLQNFKKNYADPEFQKNPYMYTISRVKSYAEQYNIKKLEYNQMKTIISSPIN